MPPKKNKENLIKTRDSITTKLNRFQQYLDEFENEANVIKLKLRLSKAEETWYEFETIQAEIDKFTPANQSPEEEARELFEATYFSVIARAEELLQQHTVINTPVTVTNSTPPASHNMAQVRLPIIDLPKFDGHFDNWTQFYDTFNSLIHTRNLDNIEKFQYLNSCLVGEAANIINSLSVTKENYQIAWDLLKTRFENKRLIVHNHIYTLMEMPSVGRESATSLRQLSDNFLKHIRALGALNQPVSSWNAWIIPLLCSKFDNHTKRAWEDTLDSTELPTLDEITSFLNKRCQVLEAIKPNNLNKNINKSVTHLATANMNKQSFSKCTFCNGQHYINHCTEFLKLSIENRYQEAKKHKLCVNCLRSNHLYKDCKASACKMCNKRHNTLLHNNTNATAPLITNVGSVKDQQASVTMCSTSVSQVILSTAIVKVFDHQGNAHECRALLDSGSQSNFISTRLCDKLKLPYHNIEFPVSGIGESLTNIKRCMKVRIKSRLNEFSSTISCLAIPTITSEMPNIKFNPDILNIPTNIKLADETFNTPGLIDLLIGAELFFQLLCIGQIQLAKNQPILQKTRLGWIISGTIGLNTTNHTKCHLSIYKNDEAMSSDNCLQNTLENFWKIEEMDNEIHYSQSEQQCEQHYQNNVARQDDGRYVVKLPKKEDIESLGDSYEIATKRFLYLEKRLKNNPELKNEYHKFMFDYERLQHMSIIKNELQPKVSYYLPHHAVLKESSTTTKLRVVFDGSAKSTTNVSLNDILLVGPTIQDTLFNILTRFRIHEYVLTADIEKMYRQINIHPDDRDLQRILWRTNESEPLQTYTLNTVTYGTTSAPFLAIRSLKQLALDEGHQYPNAANVLLRDFYVDDCLTGTPSIEEAIQLKNDLTNLLAKGQFKLYKWQSNDTNILTNETHTMNNLSLSHDQTVKTLGLFWNPNQDTLEYTINQFKTNKVSKRSVLSLISQIFDPLGLLGPAIIISKLIMQQLWQLKINWDETLPTNLHTKWQYFYKELEILNTIKIPRKLILSPHYIQMELHGFSDASESAYGACIYIRTIYNDNIIHTALLCSKTRVAPLKSVSIPRLELCAALLLSQLSNKVREAIQYPFNSIYHWTDSSIVLAWIEMSPHTLKQFVANRTSQIQSLSNTVTWKHVPTSQNPADLLSRGIAPDKLVHHRFWWDGPTWLRQTEEFWPNLINKSEWSTKLMEKRNTITMLSVHEDYSILTRYSSFHKLKNVIAWCLRIKFKQNKIYKSLTINELRYAEITILKLFQQQHFKLELDTLKLNKTVHKNSKLCNLSPFLDTMGVIRVGGRLQHAYLPYNQRHPIVLPSKGLITELIIKQEHERNFHCGPQTLLSIIRQKYWPLSARHTIRKVTRSCIKCFRCKPQHTTHTMGNLPESRVTEAIRPFIISGVDYCGPFQIIDTKGRGRKIIRKCYVSIFICFKTKAIHLEAVSELTAEAFLAALKRFIARRGMVSQIYSDNGTNFVKANSDLKSLYDFLQKQENIINSELKKQNIQWNFSPPRSPHFGGLYESAVKLFKYHFRRIYNLNLTYEEFNTVVVQIEAILNSRPLIPLSPNPDDITILTPAHFIIGDSLLAPVESDVLNKKEHLLSRWQHLQRMRQHFWKSWSRDYLHNLQQRNKWVHDTNQLQIGDVVILIEENIPPLQWKLGRIIEMHPGEDSIVRVVTVRTTSGVYKRAVRKICVLPVQKQSNSDLCN